MALDDVSTQALQEVRDRVREHAQSTGYVINPIESMREATLLGLAQHLEKYGRLFCTCHVVSAELLNNPEEAEKIVCPCSAHVQQIAEQGCCHCGLFMTKEMEQEYIKAWQMR